MHTVESCWVVLHELTFTNNCLVYKAGYRATEWMITLELTRYLAWGLKSGTFQLKLLLWVARMSIAPVD